MIAYEPGDRVLVIIGWEGNTFHISEGTVVEHRPLQRGCLVEVDDPPSHQHSIGGFHYGEIAKMRG